MDKDEELIGLAHELWATAQLMPGEGIEDGVERIVELLAARQQEPHDWIDLDERMPEPEVYVLTWDGKQVGIDWWGSLRHRGDGVTHWAPFHTPPGAGPMYGMHSLPSAVQAQPVSETDRIRFDFINADGREDSKVISHDEMRQRYADMRRSAHAVNALSAIKTESGQTAAKEIVEHWLRDELGGIEADNIGKLQFAALVRLVERSATAQPASNDALLPHLRQYLSNDGSGIVFGYDKAGIDREFAVLKNSINKGE